jgi:hypothetical protein
MLFLTMVCLTVALAFLEVGTSLEMNSSQDMYSAAGTMFLRGIGSVRTIKLVSKDGFEDLLGVSLCFDFWQECCMWIPGSGG